VWVRGCDHGGGRGQGRAGRWEHHAAGAGACRSTNPVIKRRDMLTGVLCDTRCWVGAAERCLLVLAAGPRTLSTDGTVGQHTLCLQLDLLCPHAGL
jgi:hypothetical protein